MGRLHSTVQRRVNVTECADMVQPSPHLSNMGSAHTTESLLLSERSTSSRSQRGSGALRDMLCIISHSREYKNCRLLRLCDRTSSAASAMLPGNGSVRPLSALFGLVLLRLTLPPLRLVSKAGSRSNRPGPGGGKVRGVSGRDVALCGSKCAITSIPATPDSRITA